MLESQVSIPVLDHGHVTLLDVMGNDEDIEAAARISYAKLTAEERMKMRKNPSARRKLLRYMLRNGHGTPFESAVLKLQIKMPIFVARQFVRTRTQSINEVSARYTTLVDQFYIPGRARIGAQGIINKQGTEGELPEEVADTAVQIIEDASRAAYAHYQALLQMGVSRELARVVLPTNIYTCWSTTINLRNILHFLSLRVDKHAQEEARAYAVVILGIVEEYFPITAAAFREYTLDAVHMSATEAQAVRHALTAHPEAGETVRELLLGHDEDIYGKNERNSFFAALGLDVPPPAKG